MLLPLYRPALLLAILNSQNIIPSFAFFNYLLIIFTLTLIYIIFINMRYTIVSSALAAGAAAHGVLRSVEGANGVSMPGLCGKLLRIISLSVYLN